MNNGDPLLQENKLREQLLRRLLTRKRRSEINKGRLFKHKVSTQPKMESQTQMMRQRLRTLALTISSSRKTMMEAFQR